MQKAVHNRARQVKSRTLDLAHTKIKSVCTRLQAAPTCLRHCQEIARQSIDALDSQTDIVCVITCSWHLSGVFACNCQCYQLKVCQTAVQAPLKPQRTGLNFIEIILTVIGSASRGTWFLKSSPMLQFSHSVGNTGSCIDITSYTWLNFVFWNVFYTH